MSLTIFQGTDQKFSLMQTSWASQIDPVLKNPIVNGVFVTVLVASGANTINHKLGRTPQGWAPVDINAAVTLYRSQPFNDLTLTLTASGNATVKLYVF